MHIVCINVNNCKSIVIFKALRKFQFYANVALKIVSTTE